MEHRLRRKGFENTIFCIAVVELACTATSSEYLSYTRKQNKIISVSVVVAGAETTHPSSIKRLRDRMYLMIFFRTIKDGC